MASVHPGTAHCLLNALAVVLLGNLPDLVGGAKGLMALSWLSSLTSDGNGAQPPCSVDAPSCLRSVHRCSLPAAGLHVQQERQIPGAARPLCAQVRGGQRCLHQEGRELPGLHQVKPCADQRNLAGMQELSSQRSGCWRPCLLH